MGRNYKEINPSENKIGGRNIREKGNILVKRNEWNTHTNGNTKRLGQFYLPNKKSMCTKPDIEFSDRTKMLLMRSPVYFIKTMFTIGRIQNEHGFQQCFGSTGGLLVKEWGRVNSLIPGCDNSRD